MPDATCCDDGEHCCPSDLPVCDVDEGRCLPKAGVAEGSVAWSAKTPALSKKPSLINKLFGRVGLRPAQY